MNFQCVLLFAPLAVFMHMVGSVLRTAVWILLVNLLVKVAWVLGVEVLMQNSLGFKEYGMYYTLLSISFILSFLLDFGFARFSATHTALDQASNRARNRTIIRWKFLFSILYAVGTIVLGFSLGYTFDQIYLLFIACLGQIAASYVLYFRSVFSGLKIFLWEGLGSVLDRAFMIVICLVLLFGPLRPFLSLTNYLLSQLAGYLLSFFLLGFVWLRLPKSQVEAGELNPGLRQFMGMVLPFALLVGLETINDRIGIVMLERMGTHGPAEAGKFAFGLRWLDAYKMFISLIGIILIPYYAQVLKQPERINAILKPMLQITFFTTALGCALLIAFSDQIVVLLTGTADDSLDRIFVWNVLAFLPYPFIFTLQPLLTVQLQLKKLLIAWTAGFLVNVSVSWALLPRAGAPELSIVFIASIATITVVQIYLVRNTVPLATMIYVLGKGLLVGLAVFVSTVYFRETFSSLFAITWCALISPIALIYFRVIPIDALRALLPSGSKSNS